MSFFIQACVRDGEIFTVRAQARAIDGPITPDPFDFAVNAEIEGDQMDAMAVMQALTLTGQTLTGLPIVAQTVLPGQA
jgi:hypothetical protein